MIDFYSMMLVKPAFIQPVLPHVFGQLHYMSSLGSKPRWQEHKENSSMIFPLTYVPQCSVGKKRPRSNNEEKHQRSLSDSILPDLGPMRPTPAETSGFEGWRTEDDEYWRDVNERLLLYQSTTTVKPEDLEGPPQPLDRHGNPVIYPAQIKLDLNTKTWVPTTEEEEEQLRRPNPVRDPYFVREAAAGESVTSLRKQAELRRPNWRPIEEPEPMSYGTNGASELRRERLQWEQRDWKVVHLGTSSAVPTGTRNVSSTAFLVNREDPAMFLIDVGENTTKRLLQCDWCMTHGFRWIRAIFITHLHGDHIFGLPRLLCSIGQFVQYRRRAAIEKGDDGSDPVIRIYGPYGIRGFVRSSLYWTNPVGVRFSISELVPRDTDFPHVRGSIEFNSEMFVQNKDSEEFVGVPPLNGHECPPPHPEEVRINDVHVGEDGVWHVWDESGEDPSLEIVAAPLKHRLPCFGYVFREPEMVPHGEDVKLDSKQLQHHDRLVVSNGARTAPKVEIDMKKARALGVYGSQFRVLRAGRAVTVSKSGLTVKPEDVALDSSLCEAQLCRQTDARKGLIRRRKVTILGDTCDSKLISEAARGSDLLVHEATFTELLRQKAKIAMHSTARMAGQFGKSIEAKKIVLTHFSSRHEVLLMNGTSEEDEEDSEDDEVGNDDFASPNQLISEARQGYGAGDAQIIAASDFMQHEIPAVASDVADVAESSATLKSGTMHA